MTKSDSKISTIIDRTILYQTESIGNNGYQTSFTNTIMFTNESKKCVQWIRHQMVPPWFIFLLTGIDF